MTDSERYTKASKYLNKALFKAQKLYKLSNVEIVGLLQAIITALIQIYYTSKLKVKSKSKLKGAK